MNISDLFTGQLTLASLVSAGIVLAVYLGGLIFTVLLVIGIIERIRWKNDSKKSSLASKKITISMIGLFVVFVIWGAINLVNLFFGIGFGAEPKYISMWKCPASAIKVIISSRLNYIHSCNVADTEIDDRKGKLIYLTYGPATHCDGLFCYYHDFVAVAENNKTIEVEPEPNITNILKRQFGHWCAFQPEEIESGVRKTFTTVGNELYWNFEFDNYSNEKHVIKRLSQDRYLATNENSQSCLFNGRIQILSQDGHKDATSADFSNLKVEMRKIVSITPYPIDQVIDKCLEWDMDSCYSNLAKARSEIKYCQLIEDLSTKDRCLKSIAVDTRKKDVCSMISDSLLETTCYQSFEAE